MSTTYPIVTAARILQITSAPCALADKHGNEYVGYALCGFELEWEDGLREVKRDILPFDSTGRVFGVPGDGDGYYLLAACGDTRPSYATFLDRDVFDAHEERVDA
jgi:hypothetical protein